MTIEFVFAEFHNPEYFKVEKQFPIPVENVKRYFPEATVRVAQPTPSDMNLFDRDNIWWGRRMNEYFQFKMIQESQADICISLDADMLMVSENVRFIIPLVKKFGICVPSNSRWLAKTDTEIGGDSDKQLDESGGMGYAFNSAIIAVATSNLGARCFIDHCLKQQRTSVVRQPLTLWRAAWETGLHPCLLPPQWCVCVADCGIGNEIILHVGHAKVRQHYEELIHGRK